MAGIVAGSIAGWSPIERKEDDDNSVRFGKEEKDKARGLPPSQKPETTPDFNIGPFSGGEKSEDPEKKNTTLSSEG